MIYFVGFRRKTSQYSRKGARRDTPPLTGGALAEGIAWSRGFDAQMVAWRAAKPASPTTSAVSSQTCEAEKPCPAKNAVSIGGAAMPKMQPTCVMAYVIERRAVRSP